MHSITATSANVHDIKEAHKLIRKDDKAVYGDFGYRGIEKREEIRSDEHLANIEYRINRRPKSLPKVSDNAIDWERYINYRKLTDSSSYSKFKYLSIACIIFSETPKILVSDVKYSFTKLE